ncbi:CsxC family protein [Jeotgalibacillus marinus]|uniref:CsxC family protein n=1 Tax=Jeotgalibacillus marinus TaxID=86667 RepID=A0ABV3Q761_9BACL
MSQNHNKIDPVCPVESMTQPPLTSESIKPTPPAVSFVKVPVVLVEPKIQIVVEADIPLDPPAFEIKRVGKDVFLTQCKLVPVEFAAKGEDRFVTKAKLFVGGFIRKNIEYATKECNGVIQDRIADVLFSGFTEIGGATEFLNNPILNGSSESSSRLINPKDGITPRQDKYFFENKVFYNEQPYCELVSADFFEIDFSPCPVDAHETFDTLREKIVLDLTVKVLQLQQIDTKVSKSPVTPPCYRDRDSNRYRTRC